MPEIIFPGLSAQLENEEKERNMESLRKLAREQDRENIRRERRTEARLLQTYSPVLTVLKEAAKLLEQGGHKPKINITNPDCEINSNSPMDLKLIWDVGVRKETSRQLSGGEDYLNDIFYWKEVNCRLVKDKDGITIGLKYNIAPSGKEIPGWVESGLELEDIVKVVDRMIVNPLNLDGEHDGTLPSRDALAIGGENNTRRLNIPIEDPVMGPKE